MKKNIAGDELKYTVYKYTFVFFLIMVLVNSANYTFQDLANGYHPEFAQVLIAEVIAFILFYSFVPLIYFFVVKYPVAKPRRLRNLLNHLIISLALSVVLTFSMYLARGLLWPLLGFGKYYYGILKYRLVMEYFRIVMMYAIFYGGYYWLKSFGESQRRKLQAARLEEQLAKSKVEALQMQLNPHFLFNTLNVISSTMYDDVNVADKMIADLSDLLRMTLNKKGEAEHPLGKEIEMVTLYGDIMKARFKDKLKFAIDCGKDAAGCLVPVFILQPLVENSIRHSTESVEKISVEITAVRDQDMLFLSVKDHGPGMGGSKSGNGIGINNTATRLETIYGADHKLTWGNINGGGFEVKIAIPVRKE